MKRIKAQKISMTEMIEVTIDELRKLMDLNPWISLGKYDIKYHLKDGGVIGYIAGDIHKLQMDERDMKIADRPFDCWFTNKEFFDENYKIIEE